MRPGTPLEYREGSGWYVPEGYQIPPYRLVVTPACPECRGVRDSAGSQVVTARGYSGDVAHLACRACGHRWQTPIVRTV